MSGVFKPGRTVTGAQQVANQCYQQGHRDVQCSSVPALGEVTGSPKGPLCVCRTFQAPCTTSKPRGSCVCSCCHLGGSFAKETICAHLVQISTSLWCSDMNVLKPQAHVWSPTGSAFLGDAMYFRRWNPAGGCRVPG